MIIAFGAGAALIGCCVLFAGILRAERRRHLAARQLHASEARLVTAKEAAETATMTPSPVSSPA